MKKICIRIDENLYKRIKLLGIEKDKTIQSIVNLAIQDTIVKYEAVKFAKLIKNVPEEEKVRFIADVLKDKTILYKQEEK